MEQTDNLDSTKHCTVKEPLVGMFISDDALFSSEYFFLIYIWCHRNVIYLLIFFHLHRGDFAATC